MPKKVPVPFHLPNRPRKPSLAAEFGKAYHAGVGAYYKEAHNLDAGLAAFEQSWAAFDGAEGEDLYTMAKGKELVTAYSERYRDESWKWQAGEQPFAIEVPGAPFLFLGIIDGVGRETGLTTDLSILELKSTKSPWDFCARPNGQVVGYPLALRTLYGEEVRRVRVTIAGVFKSSIGRYMAGKRKADPPKDVFTREIVDLNEWDFEEWVLDFKKKCFEIKMYEDEEYWPKQTRACSGWGGCAYAPLCVAPPNMREMFMEANYRIQEWSPLREVR